MNMVIQGSRIPKDAVLQYTVSGNHEVKLPSVKNVASAINRSWNMMMSTQEAEKCARAAIKEFIKANEYESTVEKPE